MLRYAKRPQIYVYEAIGQPGLKIGYTERVMKSGKDFDAVVARIREQHNIKTPKIPYKVLHYELAITKSGEYFTDKLVHKWLEKFEVKALRAEEDGKKTEFYDTDLENVKSIIQNIKNGTPEKGNASRKSFKMRPEQELAVKQTSEYFEKHLLPEGLQETKDAPRFLWNAKMRFGKTFTAYQLAKKGYKTLVCDLDPQSNATHLLTRTYSRQHNQSSQEFVKQIVKDARKDKKKLTEEEINEEVDDVYDKSNRK